MIAASEPLEFVPHGRTVLTKHPGQIYSKGHNVSSSENSLLYKLTNFAIKDESLLESKEDQEWWTIREVYYRVEDLKSSLQEAQKDRKSEYADSFRPPSRLKNEFNISIKSELMSGLRRDEVPSGGSSANSSSNMSKKFNFNCNQNKKPKRRPLNPKTDCFYEEELYVRGCTAVWSKGLMSSLATKQIGPEHRETIACFTLDNPIKHAAFVDFHVDINNTMLIDALNSQIGDIKRNIKIEDSTEHMESKVLPSILLIDSKCMRVYAIDGREYVASIPFQVKRVWPMKYGALLEKDAPPVLHDSLLPSTSFARLNDSHNSSFSKSRTFPFSMSARLRAESISGYDQDYTLPTCFSLAHPLDDVIPVLMKSSAQGLQYYNDGDLQIIFVSTEPSLILLYDWKLQTHSLWTVRRASRDECLAMCPAADCSGAFGRSSDFASGRAAGSPHHSRRPPATPNRSRHESPLAGAFHRQGLSPHSSGGHAGWASSAAAAGAPAPPSLPLYPDVCLDHVWTDGRPVRRDPVESPNDTKAFLHTDLVGHDYLCFTVRAGGATRLQTVRLQRSQHPGRPGRGDVIVGSVSSVPARDAVALDHLKMIALIDDAGNIVLQSGNNFVGKVHAGGVLARLLDSPYTRRCPFAAGGGGGGPRRSSLLPSREGAAPDDSALHLLSPVPHAPAARPGVAGVQDAAGARLSVRAARGALFRFALPEHAHAPLVARCRSALRAALPPDLAAQVLIRWYGVRNAPGTQDVTPAQEWSMFADLVLTLVGYDVAALSHARQHEEEPVEVATKKQRTSCDGTQDDWEYLLGSRMHRTVGGASADTLAMPAARSEARRPRPDDDEKDADADRRPQFNSDALLFPYAVQIFYAFHLLYEDLKLDSLLASDLKPLSAFLHRIARDLRLEEYATHYWLDFPAEYELEGEESDVQMSEAVLKKLSRPGYFEARPPSIFGYVQCVLADEDAGRYPHLPHVNHMSRDIIEILTTVGYGCSAGVQALSSRDAVAASSTPLPREQAPPLSPHARAVLLACERGITPRDIDNLPPALALLLVTIFGRCKGDPPADWPPEAYTLVMREDLALQADIADTLKSADEYMESLALEVLEKETAYTQLPQQGEEPPHRGEDDTSTGMEHLNTKLLSLLYPRDHRMREVFSLLQSSIPVTINLTQRPEVSDHDFIEEQEKQLFAISTRTMALPVARGMVSLRSAACAGTEALLPPRLCVAGRGPPPRRSAVGGAEHGLQWPAFHNGAAAGLALVPVSGTTIHASWVLYNRPRGAQDASAEHAGFLLALGLNGHLRDMPFMNKYEYLVKCHEMISVGLLLGLAATYRGSMDVQATKMMSIHLEPLLPTTAVELDIQQGIQVAALLGVGLLYRGTAHAHYAHVLLDEIGRPPGPEAESCTEREGYALAAGLALGMVALRAAGAAPAPLVPRLAARLRTLMLGGERPPASGAVNLDVTAPGATLALGLLFLRSHSAAVARWLAPPRTAYLLDFVRPDLLMLRVLARALVLWDDIEPSEDWIESQVPAVVRDCFDRPAEDSVDYETMIQTFCNIVAGACFGVGLRFAGSGCEDARDAVLHYVALLLRLGGRGVAELAGGSTAEACTCVCLLAAGMIMAGRGDIKVLRACRRLRARLPTTSRPAPTTPNVPPPLTYGGQMAVHSTIGLLFLGGGRSTLSSSPEAVAALIAAFFPKFPTHSEDNRYHLQAFRHLYVLAVEPRLILPRDLATGKLCYAHIQVIDLKGAAKEMRAPCIIPELDTLRQVKIDDPRYWPITFHRDHNWDQLKTFLQYTWCVDIKQRAGCLPYCDDPDGCLTVLAQSLTLDEANLWSAAADNLHLFTNDDKLRSFVRHYLREESAGAVCGDCLPLQRRRKGLKGEPVLPRQCACRRRGREEREHAQALSMLTYHCVLQDDLCALPAWTAFLKIVRSMSREPSAQHAWQLRLLLAQLEAPARRAAADMAVDGREPARAPPALEFALALKQRAARLHDAWEPDLAPLLKRYLGLPGARKPAAGADARRMLSAFVVYHALPRGALARASGLLAPLLCERLALGAEAAERVEALLS